MDDEKVIRVDEMDVYASQGSGDAPDEIPLNGEDGLFEPFIPEDLGEDPPVVQVRFKLPGDKPQREDGHGVILYDLAFNFKED